jgi:hypothetical protein
VNLNIFHSFDGDLTITLTHVTTGTSIVLLNGVGGTNEGFLIRLNADAESPAKPPDGCQPERLRGL